MDTSILTSIKKLLGITKEDTAFDADLIIHINSVLAILVQMGVGTSGFVVADKTATWLSFLPEGAVDAGLITSYVYLKVKLLFDPPAVSAVIESINKTIQEFEFRLNLQFDVSV